MPRASLYITVCMSWLHCTVSTPIDIHVIFLSNMVHRLINVLQSVNSQPLIVAMLTVSIWRLDRALT